MNRLMLYCAVAALATPLSACADRSTEADEIAENTAPATVEEAEDDTEALADATDGVDVEASQNTATEMPAAAAPGAKVAYLGATDVSMKDLIGEQIYGVDGKSIAHVDDVLIGADSRADRIVFVSGGLGGFAGKKGAMEFNNLSLGFKEAATATETNDPLLHLSMTDDQVKNVAEWDQQGLNDYRLASEIIGTKIDLLTVPGGDDDAVVHDLIMSEDGAMKSVIVQRSVVGSVGGGDRYAFDYGLLQVEQGDGGLALDVTEEQLNSASKFEYTRVDAVDEAAESARDPDDAN